MLKEYEAEMQLFRTLGMEFAKKYPEKAGRLNLGMNSTADPNIERLLEGVAFMNAKLKHKLNSGFTEVAEAILEQNFSQLVRPYPACCVLNFSIKPYSLNNTFKFKKNTIIVGKHKQSHTEVNFTSPMDIDVMPLEISKQFFSSDGKVINVCLDIKPSAGVCLDKFNFSTILLYISGPLNNALELSFNLFHHCIDAGIQMFFTNNTKNRHVKLSIGQGVCHYMQPDDNLSDSAVLHLLDFFHFKRKNCFIKLHLDEPIDFLTEIERLEIRVSFKSSLPSEKFSLNKFILNCFPGINLWKGESEPINFDNYHYEYPILPSVINRESYKIYEVNSIQLIDNQGKASNVSSMSSMDDLENKNFYSVRKNYINNSDYLYYLNLNLKNSSKPQYISCNITLSNSQFISEILSEGNYLGTANSLPDGVIVSNKTKATMYYQPPAQNKLYQNLLASITYNLSTLSDIDVLKKILNLYNWSNESLNLQLINSIETVKISTNNILKNGIISKVVVYNITCYLPIENKEPFLYFFGLSLHKFVRECVVINSELDTILFILPEKLKYKYSSRTCAKQPC